ncbi:DNA polymerase III subunit delta, partial [Candidatus Pelagibacter sp.]|nr:DNA polymerase III subunit delta [Candidatus Pelagibacter sp.]
TFLNKSKKIDKLILEFKKNKNIDLTISSSKPPIFWKDKEITKQQITKWSPRHIKELIYSLNQLELTIKKNLANSINIITDFIIEKSAAKTNN